MQDDTVFYERPSLNVEAYDVQHGYATAVLGDDVPFYIDQARDAGGPVLDLGGGTGRVAWPLAEAGFDVTSLDLSAPMLARSEAKRPLASPAAQTRVKLVEADARAFDLGREFGLVVTPGRVFQMLLTPDDQRTCLATIRRHLRPGGILVLQLFDPLLEACAASDGVPENGDRGSVVLPGSGHRVARQVTYRRTEPFRQVMTEVWEFTELDDDGRTLRRDEERLELRWTYRYEMRYLLEAAGFEVTAEYSDFRGSPPKYAAEQIWIARRPLD
jgi:SAM-dependent methyltransferase